MSINSIYIQNTPYHFKLSDAGTLSAVNSGNHRQQAAGNDRHNSPPIVTDGVESRSISEESQGTNLIPNPPLEVDDMEEPELAICNLEMFMCHDGSDCITDQFVCDGQQNCIDNSDESNCPAKIDGEGILFIVCIPAS